MSLRDLILDPTVEPERSLDLFPETLARAEPMVRPDLEAYDTYLIGWSGGKDSLGCVLHLLEMGVDRSRIELWHHDVDGREGSALMDWPVTRDYCRKVAAALGLKIYFSWREGGFEREMLRHDQRTAPVLFERPDGSIGRVGGINGPLGTRRRFPQVSADLSVRWCSSSLKIEVGAGALRNQERFNGHRTLFITGERGEESTARAKYAILEPHRSDRRGGALKRYVDHWRPLRDWTTAQVWDLIRRWRIAPHPAYGIGLGRASCMACIFGSARQWATIKLLVPEAFEAIARYEESFGCTIHRDRSVRALAAVGVPYEGVSSADAQRAISFTFDAPVIMDEWILPIGAFGESCGPT